MEINSTSPLYRSRFGGLWPDRADAKSILAKKVRDGDVKPDEAEWINHFIAYGYVVFPRAIATDVVDDYLEFFERAWDRPPPGIYAHSAGAVHALSRNLYHHVTKVSDLHYYFARAEEIVFPAFDQYRLQGERFSEAVRGVGHVPTTLEDAIGNMAVIDAIFRSVKSRRWESPADS